MDKKLLSVSEASTLLGIGRSLFYSLVMRGQIQNITIGRARRIPAAALDEFIQHQLQQEGN